MTLTLDQALTVARETLAEAVRRGLQPMAVAVLDPATRPLALLCDERTSLNRPEIAVAKAAGCLAMGFGGRELARRAEAMPGFFTALGQIFPKGIVALPGGVLVRDAHGALLGAVGVSGDTSDNDEVCALAGIAAAALVADTGA